METVQSKQSIALDPGHVMALGVFFGFLFGFLMVVLDPWVRFPQVPLRINWAEAFLTASMVGAYAALLGWTVTTFWRTSGIWIIPVLVSPLVTGIVIVWNYYNAVFGVQSQLLTFLLVVAAFQLLSVLLTVIYLQIMLRVMPRPGGAYTAIPLVLALLVFLGVGGIRWRDADAQSVVGVTDTYAQGITSADYQIEYRGIRYRDNLAPVGTTIIYTEEEKLSCQTRLYANDTEITCRPYE